MLKSLFNLLGENPHVNLSPSIYTYSQVHASFASTALQAIGHPGICQQFILIQFCYYFFYRLKFLRSCVVWCCVPLLVHGGELDGGSEAKKKLCTRTRIKNVDGRTHLCIICTAFSCLALCTLYTSTLCASLIYK